MKKRWNRLKNSTTELQFLISCLRIADKKQREESVYLLKDFSNIDWDLFLKLAANRHRVAGPVYRNLAQYGKKLIPEHILARLKELCSRQAIDMLAKTSELVKLENLFEKNGIRALPFKGPMLGAQLYGDFYTRYSKDLDIVVPREDIFRAEKLLVKSGYERVAPRYELSKKQLDAFIKENAHFGFFNPDTQINVELHWKFFPGHTHSFDFDYLWQNRQIIKTGESLVPVCSADDTIMLLLIHGAKHSWRRLLWLNDIFLILGNYTDRDWKRLIDRIERLDIERLSVSAIMLLHDLFGLTLPDDINKMAGRDKKTAFLVRVSKTLIEESDESHLAAIFSSRLKFILCNFFMVPGIRYEVTFALRTIFPCDFEYIFLPDRLFFLYYLFRPFFWFFRKFTGIKPMHAKRRS